jgi:hypothetical protein
MSLVLDSWATLAWIYGDETTEQIRRVFQAIADDGAVVPALWRLEIANSLTLAVRRGRIDAYFCRAALTDLAFWDIKTRSAVRLKLSLVVTSIRRWGATVNFGRAFGLRVGDRASPIEAATSTVLSFVVRTSM